MPDNNLNTADAQARRLRSKSNAKNVLEIVKTRLSGLSSTRRAMVAERLEEMPESYRNRYVKAVLGKSPVTAIEAHCFECISWQRGHAKGCTGEACALWSYRPERGK